MTTITTPAWTTMAQRVRAPAPTLSAVPESEPPPAMPWKKEQAMLAAPWPMKSRESSLSEPSVFG